VKACDALRPGVPQRSHKLLYGCHFRLGRGGGVGRSAQTQKSRFAKNRNFKFAKSAKPKFRKLLSHICFRASDLEIVHRKIVLLFFEISGKTLASSPPCDPFAMCEVHI
jgi:hypothetical protein